jgi:hypothetical protein
VSVPNQLIPAPGAASAHETLEFPSLSAYLNEQCLAVDEKKDLGNCGDATTIVGVDAFPEER